MDFSTIINIFLHTEQYLHWLVSEYHSWIYVILFAIIFLETGIVITPFLPGDSVLFGIGAIAATTGLINVPLMVTLLCIAAILGDSVNYEIGSAMGHKIRNNEKIPFIKTEHLTRTQAFFERHGGKTITIARFMPIIRTFAPFISGAAKMPYPKFLFYNVIGGLIWVFLMFGLGYFFGNLPFVQKHFSLVILAIIAISLLPAVIALIKNKKQAK